MPVRNAATQVIQKLSTALAGALPIIGVGGIGNADDALEKINAGANLIQVYSGLIYQGPALVSECVRAFKRV